MYFHSAFYIFGMTLVFVECQSHREGDFHDAKIVECPIVRNEVARSLKMTMPMPRDMPVQLMPQPGHEFMPDTVYIPQCTGSCMHGKSSMPMKTAKKSVHVSMKTPNGFKCGVIELDEHKQCKCDCRKMSKDCNDLQWWDQKSCACKCINEREKMRECKENMFWNRDTCQCECTYMKMECASGSKWSREHCRCIEILH